MKNEMKINYKKRIINIPYEGFIEDIEFSGIAIITDKTIILNWINEPFDKDGKSLSYKLRSIIYKDIAETYRIAELLDQFNKKNNNDLNEGE